MIDAAYGEWLARGQAHQQAGLPIDAMLCYRQALNVNRHAVVARFHLGETLSALRMRKDAVDAWRLALTMQPRHVPTLVALADELQRAGAHVDAAANYRRALDVEPANATARAGLALAMLAAGDARACEEIASLQAEGAGHALAWNELARLIAAMPPSAPRSMLLERIAAELPADPASAVFMALAAEDAARAGQGDRARLLLDHAAAAPAVDDPEALRRMAIVAGRLGTHNECEWASRYAARCVQAFAPSLPVLWPRRNSGDALRVAYLIAPGSALVVGDVEVGTTAYLEAVVAAHPRERFNVAVFVVDATPLDAPVLESLRGMRVAALGTAPDPAVARALGEGDYDALIDLAGMSAAIGSLLAARPARTLWTCARLRDAHVAPLIGALLPAPETNGSDALARHRIAIESTLRSAIENSPWYRDRASLAPDAMARAWRGAVAAHQSGDGEAALAGYRSVLAEQPGFAPAEYFSGVLLRDGGFADAA